MRCVEKDLDSLLAFFEMPKRHRRVRQIVDQRTHTAASCPGARTSSDTTTETDRKESPWMTSSEVASYLGVSLGTLRNWVSRRYVPFARRGHVIRFHRGMIDAWFNAGACAGRRRLPRRRSSLAVPTPSDSPPPDSEPGRTEPFH